MIFHSLDFIVFFLVVVAVYWRLDRSRQNLLLVAASYLFYGWVHPWFLTLIFATTAVDFWAAQRMEDRPDRRGWFMGVSLAANLGLLGFFKYFNFFSDNVHRVLSVAGLDLPRAALSIVLPVGISFYTFQELSYTIEVYRGTLRARRRFVDFAAFVCFFPQLVAGPIERASRLLPQFETERRFEIDRAIDAVSLIVWGYFKKLVIADNVGVIANKVFLLRDPGFCVLWAGVFAFAVQIYADFSAYSDIARGTARWLGFGIMRNFDHPYVARGPADFWRRWHISLSTWFRDYVYIPLGGSAAGPWGRARNVMATFLLSGFWHGASWNYVLWGAYHGILLLAGRALAPLAPRGNTARAIVAPVQIGITFVLVTIGWLLFRETDIGYLMRDLRLSPFHTTRLDRSAGAYLFLLSALYSMPLWVHAAWSAAPALVPSRRPLILQAIGCGALFAIIVVFRSHTSLDFIYFQF